MRHLTHSDFWKHYHLLPKQVQLQADKRFDLLKKNPKHPSLHFKRVGRFWSARVTYHHRAMALDSEQGCVWFWIGLHTEYERYIKQ